MDNIKKIRLIIFDESYWSRGLIYTQNILPLIKLKENNPEKYLIEVLCYTSVFHLIKYKNPINRMKQLLMEKDIKVTNIPTSLYNFRLLINKNIYFLYVLIQTLPFIFYYSIKDKYFTTTHVYNHLRSYKSAYAYTKLYFGNAKQIFDPRSDFICENLNIGNWKKNSFVDVKWRKIENQILMKVTKTIFISKPLLIEILQRNLIEYNVEHHKLFYNSIDFKNFQTSFDYRRRDDDYNFLYTGSLGHWNDLKMYLGFFRGIKNYLPDATFTIITSSLELMYIDIIKQSDFDSIRKDIFVYRNVNYEELGEVYKKCSFGLQMMNASDSRMGVKFVEYLASGLIPIINTNVRGALEFCSSSIGITIDANSPIDFEKLSIQIKSILKTDYKKHIELLKPHFDINSSFKILNDIYN